MSPSDSSGASLLEPLSVFFTPLSELPKWTIETSESCVPLQPPLWTSQWPFSSVGGGAAFHLTRQTLQQWSMRLERRSSTKTWVKGQQGAGEERVKMQKGHRKTAGNQTCGTFTCWIIQSCSHTNVQTQVKFTLFPKWTVRRISQIPLMLSLVCKRAKTTIYHDSDSGIKFNIVIFRATNILYTITNVFLRFKKSHI